LDLEPIPEEAFKTLKAPIRQLRARKQTQASQNSITNTASEVIEPINAAKSRKSRKSRKKKGAGVATGAPVLKPLTPPPKFRSILAQEKPTRELR
jgi:hypothetical protein